MYTTQQVAQAIDHAVLKPFATNRDIIENAKMCIEHSVKSLCVRPSDVKLAADQLKGSSTVVSMVVGFPHGSNCTPTKVLETKIGLAQGAVEVDMVMNIGKFLSGDYEYVHDDVKAVVKEAKKANALIKVILETCFLSDAQIADACKICESAGADFVKTSTGFGDASATPEAIDIIINTVGQTMGVKASGGIRTWDTAVAYLDQGCTRLGLSATEAILDREGADDQSY